MKLVIACGGTGGHLFPGLAVAEEMRQRGHEILLLISEKEIDTVVTRGADQFEFRKLAAIGMPSVFSPAIIPFLLRLRESIRQCRGFYREFKPHAILGMGGFTSMPPVIASWRDKIPAFIHESNAIPGKANRTAARFTKSVFLGFAECAPHFKGRPCEVTGTPIRTALRKQIDRVAAFEAFKLDPARRTILVIGGSQGARGLNQLVVRTLPLLREWNAQFIHFTGREDERYVAENYTRAGIPAFVAPFFERMELAYCAADAVIARSGASTLSELAYYGIPSILVPYPYAAEDHQTRNAEIFAAADAAVLLQERDSSPPVLLELLDGLVNNCSRHAKMAANMKKKSPEDAASTVASKIETLAGAIS